MRNIPWAGLIVAVAAFGLDRLHKFWMIGPYEIALRGRHSVAPFLDLVLVWNRGVSYGLLEQNSEVGRWLLVAVALLGGIIFGTWMWRAATPLVSIAMALIVAGALSNGIDRIVYGAVADFFLLHVGDFEWYIFNLADVWIVVGVAIVIGAWWMERPEKVENA